MATTSTLPVQNMLNYQKLFQHISAHNDTLWHNQRRQCHPLYQAWLSLVHDEQLAQTNATDNSTQPLPTWQETLGNTYHITPYAGPYHMIAIDGSQIYPDHHEGTDAYMINIGTAAIHYACDRSSSLHSEPYVYSKIDPALGGPAEAVVTGQRHELELLYGTQEAQKLFLETMHPVVLFFDGSLIFWHVENMNDHGASHFFSGSLALLEHLYANAVPHLMYSSMPRNRDLVLLARFLSANTYNSTLDLHDSGVYDTSLVQAYLPVHHRTTIFCSNYTLAKTYPGHLRPHFFYINNGYEIARIEIPQWLACNEQFINLISATTIDQICKGYGYPIGLAEAHQQAVLTSTDRALFYATIAHHATAQQAIIVCSQKTMKKRAMNF
jgi:NurA domain